MESWRISRGNLRGKSPAGGNHHRRKNPDKPIRLSAVDLVM